MNSYTRCMTHRVGPKGQVVIPKSLRDALGIEPGDEVEFKLVGNGVNVTLARAGGSLRGSLRDHELVRALESDRRDESR